MTANQSGIYGFRSSHRTEKAVLAELRTTLDDKVPVLNDAWSEDRLPEEIIEPLESLRLMDPPALKAAGEPVRAFFEAMRPFELARCDINVVTFSTRKQACSAPSLIKAATLDQVAN